MKIEEPDLVHSGCGGAIRRRVYDKPNAEEERNDRLKAMCEEGAISPKELKKRMEKPIEFPFADECKYCGAESDLVPQGRSEEQVTVTLKVVPKDTYGGRILGAV